MFGATDTASRCASALLLFKKEREIDYTMDGSGELGAQIARGHNRTENDILVRFGYTPETWNELLEQRLGGHGYVSYLWTSVLGVQSREEYDLNNTFVCTLGYPGHPEAEWSSLAYLSHDPEGGQVKSEVHN